MWVMSDRGIPRSLRMMQGFGVHTFRLVNGTAAMLAAARAGASPIFIASLRNAPATARRLLREGMILLAPDLIWAEVANALWRKWRDKELEALNRLLDDEWARKVATILAGQGGWAPESANPPVVVLPPAAMENMAAVSVQQAQASADLKAEIVKLRADLDEPVELNGIDFDLKELSGEVTFDEADTRAGGLVSGTIDVDIVTLGGM